MLCCIALFAPGWPFSDLSSWLLQVSIFDHPKPKPTCFLVLDSPRETTHCGNSEGVPRRGVCWHAHPDPPPFRASFVRQRSLRLDFSGVPVQITPHSIDEKSGSVGVNCSGRRFGLFGSATLSHVVKFELLWTSRFLS